MASIDITRNHKLSRADVRTKVEEVLARIKGETGLVGTWSGDVFKITKPADGSFTVSDTSVRVVLDLPFLLRPLKGKIEERINGELTRALG